MKKKSVPIDISVCFLLGFAAVVAVNLIMKMGLPSGSEVLLHLGRIKILMDDFPNAPRWNMWWFFGCPFLRFWPPLGYYFYAFLGWVLHLSVFEALGLGATTVFAIGAVSTYLLAKELGLKRFGSMVSSVLFLTTYNIYFWLSAGNVPNITAVMFTPTFLLAYLRAVRKTTLANVIYAGLALFFTSLIGNAIILALILIFTSITLAVIRPELIAVPATPREPPRYTMILPKVLASTALVATVLGLWWWGPLLIESGGLSSLLQDSIQGVEPSLGDLLWPSRDFSGYFYVGLGHLLLALGGTIVSVLKRGNQHKLALSWFLMSVMCGVLPLLGLPAYLYRLWAYIGLFIAILGGIFLSQVKTIYRRRFPRRNVRILLCAFTLILSVLPSVTQASQTIPSIGLTPFPSEWASERELASFDWLESHTEPGERVALSGREISDLSFNVYTMIPQSYGSGLQAMINEFTYVFWYYTFKVPWTDAGDYAPYFVRNFNVKYFVGTELPGMSEVYPGIYELESGGSSLVDAVGSSSILVMVIGDDAGYRQVFESISPTNPSEVVLVNGGDRVEQYDLETLNLFNAIYLYGFRSEYLGEASELLESYVQAGGGLILDTGKLLFDVETDNIPNPFPVSKTVIGMSQYNLSESEPTGLTEGIDFSKFSNAAFNISYSTPNFLKDGARVLVTEEGRPVVAYWDHGSGRVLWSGLHLPYHAMYYGNREEGRFLVNMLRSVAPEPESESSSVEFEYKRPEEMSVFVKGASRDDAVWLKISYYPGWTAYLDDAEGLQELPIFIAGPNMMLVFPGWEGDYQVRFTFEKTLVVKISEYLSIAGFVSITLIILFSTYVSRVRAHRLKSSKADLAKRRKSLHAL